VGKAHMHILLRLDMIGLTIPQQYGGTDKMKMKKLTAVLVLMIFIISMVPFAAAEEETTTDSEETTELTEEIEVVDVDEEVAEDLEEIAEDSPEIVEAVEELPETVSETTCFDRVSEKYPDADKNQIKKVCKWKRHLRKKTNKLLTSNKPMPKIREAVKKAGERTPVMDKKRITPELAKEKREAMKDRLEKARQDFVMAKNRYENMRKNYAESKPIFQKAKEDYKGCKDDDSEECEQKRTELKKHSKEFLLNAADVITESLNKLKSKIESSEDLEEDEMAEMLADVEERISEIEDARDLIENLDEESTNEEVREAANTINKAWKKTKAQLKKGVGQLIGAKIKQILFQSENLYDKFTKTSERLADKGQDVSELDALLAEYKENLDNAKEAYNNAEGKWKDAKDAEDAEDLIEEAHAYMGRARNYLKETKDTLRQIVNEIKNKNGSLDMVSDESEDETEDQAEDEIEAEDEEEIDEDEETEVEDASTEEGSDEVEEDSSDDAEDETSDDEDNSDEEEDDDSEDEEQGSGQQNQQGQE